MKKQITIARFVKHTKPEGLCMVWTGCILQSTKDRPGGGGYGLFGVNRKNRLVHRYAYEFFKGPIPQGMTIDHLCRNRRCVNPEHLEAVTGKENTLRGEGWAATNSQKLICINGHRFSARNTYLRDNKDGTISRQCKKCKLRKTQEWRERNAK